MENNLEILGNDSSVIYYNLNKQYGTVRKVIITKEIIFSHIEDSSLEEVFSKLELSNQQSYLEILSDAKKEEVFDFHLSSELYKSLNEVLPKISSSMADIKLKEYNFMNSVSNTKFTVAIRCENFSITKYYLEKAEIIATIKNLLKEYLEFKGNLFRTTRIKNFHIEIYESEEIQKYVILKKEGTSLLLSSIYGFEKNTPLDYTCGNEFYVSESERFNFYRNTQTSAVVREYNKLIEAKTKDFDKVLANDELILINNNTKQINDVILEMYINRKGALRILNASLSENGVYANSKNGFFINRSSKNFEKINILTLRDNVNSDVTEENNILSDVYQTLNFLLIRNESEVKDLLLEFEKINSYDGIIFNTNFYSPILDKIGQVNDIDIIYYSSPLTKSRDVKIDLNTVTIEMPNTVQNSAVNPFSNILNENRRGLDLELEKLKMAEMTAQRQVQRQVQNSVAQSDISNLAQGLISSPNATTSNSQSKMSINNNGSQGKKSAISFLADVALASVASKGYSEDGEKISQGQVQQQSRQNPQDVPIRGAGFGAAQPKSFIKMREPQVQSVVTPVEQAVYGGPQAQFTQQQNISQVVSAASILDLPAPKKPIISESRYDFAIAVKILTNPGISPEGSFADANNISEVEGGEIFFLTTNPDEMQNSNLKYILPVTMYLEGVRRCHLLINSINEFFLVSEKKEEIDYFLNLSHIDESIKKNYLKFAIERFQRISIILLKEDIKLLEEIINKIDVIYVRDIENEEDLNEVKSKVISYEKRYLMKNF